MRYFPLFADLQGRCCLVVGGGEVALRKVRLLLSAGAKVRVVAPRLHPELQELQDAGRIVHEAGRFRDDHLAGALLVIAATADAAANHHVRAACLRQNVLVNCVDDATASSFIVPAIVDRTPLIVAISSGGAAPVLARRLRQWLETVLPQGLGLLARLAGELRGSVKRRLPAGARRGFWERQFTGDFGRLALAGQEREARRALHLELERDAGSPAGTGRLSLVGAGPGDPSLLTLRALQRLGEADVVLYDRLVSQEVLSLARRDATLVAVGKRAGGGCAQEEIHALMLGYARAGQHVVRLKGGDPFIFGRGGEELAAARAAGIDCEVVPGITAAVGCAAATGLPLTLRGVAHAVTFVTAQAGEDLEPPDWAQLAAPGHTLAIYMGAARAATISHRLIGHGRAADTPVAIVQNGTTPAQRLLGGRLDGLADLLERHAVEAPAMIFIGETAALAAEQSIDSARALLETRGARWMDIALAS